MAGEPIASRYAQALLEIGVEHQKYEALRDQITELASLFEQSKPFRTALLNPGLELEERRRVIEAVADRRDWDQMVVNFALLMVDNDRIALIPTVADELTRLVNEKTGKVRARVTSASELDGEQREAIEKALGQISGKDVVLETEVDPELLGGVVARIGSTVYDGSIKRQIERLRSSILAEV